MKRGVALSLLVAIISGVSIYVNSVFVSAFNPILFAITRNIMVAFMLSILLVLTGTWKRLKFLTLREWTMIVLVGVVGGGIPFALFFTGLSQVGALNANILQKSLFLWVALFAVPFLHERISKVQAIGYLLLFVGMFIVGGTFSVVPNAGSWLVLSATILWAIEQVIAKITLRYVHPLLVSWGRIVFGLPFLFLVGAFMGNSNGLVIQSTLFSLPVIVSSVFLTLYMTTWYSALSIAPVTLVSSLLVFAPVVTALLGGLVSHKPIVYDQFISLLFVIIGIGVIAAGNIFSKKRAVI